MTLPWQGTTEEISSEDDSRYETPGGAQNKVNVSQEYLLHLLKLAVTGLSNGSEAAIARVSDPYGITYDWLKDRLDAMDKRAQKVQNSRINVKYPNGSLVGAKGDGVTDDTVAILAILEYAKANKLDLYYPAGTYLTDSIDYGYTNKQINVYGEDARNTILQKKTADGKDLFIVGSPAMTGYMGGLTIQNITFSGKANDTPASLRCYNLVRNQFVNCRFYNSINGFIGLGGMIANTFYQCFFNDNQAGYELDKFTFTDGHTDYPNLNNAISCLFLDNSVMGVRFDGGRQLNISDSEIEGNGYGTAIQPTKPHGALWVGENIGVSDGLLSPGVNLRNTWVEANTGSAAISLGSGRNNLNEVYLVSNQNAVYDVYISGGKYRLEGMDCDTVKTWNIYEEPSVLRGNFIIDCDYSNANVNLEKTMIIDGSHSYHQTIKMRGGETLATLGIANPVEQMGYDGTASGVVTITFPKVFLSNPHIFIQMSANSDSTLESTEVYNVSNTGFTVRKKKLTSGSNTVGLSTAGFTWRAVGELWHP